MIIYQASKSQFLHHALRDDIEDVVSRQYRSMTGHGVGPSEIQAWKHSLLEMAKVLGDDEIPDDAGVAIEYQLPQSSKRIDFVITGEDASARTKVIIVELKQWSESRRSEKDAIVWARRGGRAGEREGPHPSYQAWSYAAYLQDFNAAVEDGEGASADREELRDKLGDRIRHPSRHWYRRRLGELLAVGGLLESAVELVDHRRRLGAEAVLHRVGIAHDPHHRAEHGTGLGQQHEPVTINPIRDGTTAGPGAFLQGRQQAIPHRPVVTALRRVQFLGLERLDDRDQVGLLVRALQITPHPIERFRDATRDLSCRECEIRMPASHFHGRYRCAR